jgi:hypothetical protein
MITPAVNRPERESSRLAEANHLRLRILPAWPRAVRLSFGLLPLDQLPLHQFGIEDAR